MNGKQVKFERAQLRNVVLQQLPTLIQSETMTAAAKELAIIINSRLDAIAGATEKEMDRISKEATTFRSFAIRELQMQLNNELGNISGTLLAWQNVLVKRLGVTDMEAFDSEVAEEKVNIMNKLQAEAQVKADAEAAATLQANKAAADAKALAADKAVQDELASKENA